MQWKKKLKKKEKKESLIVISLLEETNQLLSLKGFYNKLPRSKAPLLSERKVSF